MSQTIDAEPRNADALVNRGYAEFVKGDMKAAANDLERALQAASDPYAEMFLFLARAKMNEAAAPDLQAYSAKLNPGAWPAPAIDLLLGRSAPEALLAAAKGRD